MRPTADNSLVPDRVGDVHEIFRNLQAGYGYGIAWTLTSEIAPYEGLAPSHGHAQACELDGARRVATLARGLGTERLVARSCGFGRRSSLIGSVLDPDAPSKSIHKRAVSGGVDLVCGRQCGGAVGRSCPQTRGNSGDGSRWPL